MAVLPAEYVAPRITAKPAVCSRRRRVLRSRRAMNPPGVVAGEENIAVFEPSWVQRRRETK